MTLLGLDFDNTLVSYDKLFHQLALEKGLIDLTVPASKASIRDHLRSRNLDNEFTLLQGEVYGLRILEAEPAEGVLASLREMSDRGIQMAIISHKTVTPYAGPKYALRDAATSWLTKHKFFEKGGPNMNSKNVFFEETKQGKIDRIKALNCTHYVDDLEEIVKMIEHFTTAILYQPSPQINTSKRYNVMRHWKELSQIIG